MQGEAFDVNAAAAAGVCLSSGTLPGCDLLPRQRRRAAAVAADVALEGILADVSTLSSFQLATLHLAGPATAATVEAALLDRLRVTGRTASIATDATSAARAPPVAQAAALLALLATNASMAELEAGVAAGAPNLGASYASALTALSLAASNTAAGSALPDLTVDVTAGSATLLTAEFDGADSAAAQATTPFEDVPAGAPLTASASGNGTATVAATLAFVPADIPASATFAGLFVTRAITAVNTTTTEPQGEPLAAVPLATTVAFIVSVRPTLTQACLLIRALRCQTRSKAHPIVDEIPAMQDSPHHSWRAATDGLQGRRALQRTRPCAGDNRR